MFEKCVLWAGSALGVLPRYGSVLQIEQGYLIPAGSTIHALDEIDRAGVRVGVSEGSTSEATQSRELRNASVVRTPSLKAAIDMPAAGKLEAFAKGREAAMPLVSRFVGDANANGVVARAVTRAGLRGTVSPD